jgi:hypothetical protein
MRKSANQAWKQAATPEEIKAHALWANQERVARERRKAIEGRILRRMIDKQVSLSAAMRLPNGRR